VLINLAAKVPSFFSRFERVAEIVTTDDQAKEQARDRYKFYQQRGYELETHKLSN
jgi:DNA polymerase-3 subunit chi